MRGQMMMASAIVVGEGDGLIAGRTSLSLSQAARVSARAARSGRSVRSMVRRLYRGGSAFGFDYMR
jgi:hypothetical protein